MHWKDLDYSMPLEPMRLEVIGEQKNPLFVKTFLLPIQMNDSYDKLGPK